MGNKKAERLIIRIEALNDQKEMAIKNNDEQGFIIIANKMIAAIKELADDARQNRP